VTWTFTNEHVQHERIASLASRCVAAVAVRSPWATASVFDGLQRRRECGSFGFKNRRGERAWSDVLVAFDGAGHTVNSSEFPSASDSSEIRLVDDVDGGDQASKIARCEEIIEYDFQDKSLLLGALTHASGASHRLASNERLEFLGDAVLGLVVCQWLYEEYPEYNEGDLTKIKSSVVSRRSCGKVAVTLGLDRCLIVGRGVTRNRSFPRSLVSDVFESVVAGVYLDGGAELVTSRLKKWLQDEVRLAVDSQGAGNYKSSLQQYAQRELASTPVYRLVRESGPDHRKSFLIAAVIADQHFTPAWGNNKKDAEQRAAANALADLHHQPLPFPEEST
jgi:ribonuclease-3